MKRAQSDDATAARRQDIIRLNVGGRLFQTRRSTLMMFAGLLRTMFDPATDFGDEAAAESDGAYFIDRSGELFDGILAFLRTGRAVAPPHVPVDQFQDELNYYFETPPLAETPALWAVQRSRSAARFLDAIVQLVVECRCGAQAPPKVFEFDGRQHFRGFAADDDGSGWHQSTFFVSNGSNTSMQNTSYPSVIIVPEIVNSLWLVPNLATGIRTYLTAKSLDVDVEKSRDIQWTVYIDCAQFTTEDGPFDQRYIVIQAAF